MEFIYCRHTTILFLRNRQAHLPTFVEEFFWILTEQRFAISREIVVGRTKIGIYEMLRFKISKKKKKKKESTEYNMHKLF